MFGIGKLNQGKGIDSFSIVWLVQKIENQEINQFLFHPSNSLLLKEKMREKKLINGSRIRKKKSKNHVYPNLIPLKNIDHIFFSIPTRIGYHAVDPHFFLVFPTLRTITTSLTSQFWLLLGCFFLSILSLQYSNSMYYY